MAAMSARSDGHDESKGQKEKLGHRRIDEQGEVSYKKVSTNALMAAIQLGISNSIGSLASTPKRDVLMQDFEKIYTVSFPSAGSATTPSHQYGDFTFKAYAPIAFRYFRELFQIKPADFLRSICAEPLKELSNAGASGSIFYVSYDDQFIIKTVQHKEAEFLQKLLPGYYMNLNQNPRTFLPKFFGLFCYQSLGKNIRLLVMDNLLPQSLTMHEKYDLKGSTYKRLASSKERAKPSPTLKDLDFMEYHTEGFQVDAHVYDTLIRTLSRDCLVLESFKIMDYSLLMGVHNVDSSSGGIMESDESDERGPSSSRDNKNDYDADIPGRIIARNANGDRLILFLGIIDILQNYRLLKKLEHTWKAVLHDGDSISVHNPNFYAQRFLSFMQEKVFRRSLPLKSSPSRRRARRSMGGEEEERAERERQGAPVSARDVQPTLMMRSGNRRSYGRQDTEGGLRGGLKKRTERLFAPTSNQYNNDIEPEQLVVSGV